MSKIDRRTFIKYLSASATFPWLAACSQGTDTEEPAAKTTASTENDLYSIPTHGNVRILHYTDFHGQLNPVYFREPNVNLGIGDAYNRIPHLVGNKLLTAMNLKPDTLESYAYTYLDFENAARKYGRTGGMAHMKTLIDRLRKQVGKENTLTFDGGDTWQGSGTSLWTRGVDMVEASNIMGVDVMVGHWEFTYREEEVLSNVALFKGDFIGQNVRVKESSLMDDDYIALTEKYDGRGLYDEDAGYAFQPYVIKEVNGVRICIIGQAFPRTANANAPEFFPDWSFGLREDDMIEMVEMIREEEKPDAIVLLSHNGMDVDIKMAERVAGLNVVFGGHTHDGMPKPIKVKNVEGGECWVTNAGCSGKYLGVLDMDVGEGGIKSMKYHMLPIISELLPADKELDAYIKQMRTTKYDEKIIESRSPKFFFNKTRVGKTYEEILSEKLAIADRLLYRRGNLMGTWDQVVCNALRWEYDADISMSPGVRWGTSTLKGDWITMEDVMTQCSLTYGETYVMDITGKQILDIIEQVADNLFDPDPYLQSGGDMVRIGGLDYTMTPKNKLYDRITDARLDNGDPIEADKTYKMAGWAVVNRTPDGRLIWDVIHDYILNTKGKDNVLVLPKINHPKLIGISNNPGIADYSGELG